MLGTEKKVRTLYDDGRGRQTGPSAAPARRGGVAGRLGLVMAVLAVVLALGVYMVLNARIGVLTRSVTDLPTRIAALDAKVAALESLPATLRRQIAAERLAAVAVTARSLSAGLETEEQKAAAGRIADMAKELAAELAQ